MKGVTVEIYTSFETLGKKDDSQWYTFEYGVQPVRPSNSRRRTEMRNLELQSNRK